MNKTRRMLAILLALCLTAGAVPFAAFSATTEELANRKNSGSSTLVDTTINAVSDYVATAAADTGASEKLADGTNANQPFPTSIMNGGHYRIPALVTLSDGTLVAAADARWHAWDYTDDNGDIDTIVSYSKDNGANWTYTFANYDGTDNAAGVSGYTNNMSATFIDPALVEQDGTLYMLVDLFPGQANEANCSGVAAEGTGYDANGYLKLKANANASDYAYYLKDGRIYDYNTNTDQGYSVDGEFYLSKDGITLGNLFVYSQSYFQPMMTSYLYLTTSTDGGASWLDPVILNTQVKSGDETFYGVGPGRGLVTADGTIMFSCYEYSGSASSQRASVIYSTDGVTWHRTDDITTSIWSSETQLVQLSDGTIRAFFRNGQGKICYVDAAGDAQNGYIWGNYVDTGVSNQSNCMISAIQYSKTFEGKDVLLVSCPASTGGRYNGKIYTFTVGNNNALTLQKAYEINGSSEAFSYSCLTEQKDGSIGLLYEKGDSGSITYVNLDTQAVTGLTFDKIYIADSATNQEVSALSLYTFSGAKTLSIKGVLGTQAATAESSDTGIVTAQVDGTTLTLTPVAEGEAKVTVTVTDAVAARAVGNTDVTTIELDVTVWENEGVDITLYVGKEQTLTDDTGNYENAAGNLSPNGSVASMTLVGTSASEPDVKPLTSLANGDVFYIEVTKGVYLTTDGGTTTNLDEAEEWTVSVYNAFCCIKNSKKEYLNVGKDGAVSTTVAPSYMDMVAGVVVGYYSNQPAGTPVQVSPGNTVTTTEITFTGIGPGKTTAKVGETVYNITVVEDIRNVTLFVGDTLTDTIEGAVYNESNVTKAPDGTVTTMVLTGTTATGDKKLNSVSQIENGAYIIYNTRSGNTLTAIADGGKLKQGDKASENSIDFWHIEVLDDGYTVRDSAGNYLYVGNSTAGTTNSETKLLLEYQPDGYWYICNADHTQGLNDFGGFGTVAAGWVDLDVGSRWIIGKITETQVEGHTEVTFTGNKVGTTTAKVGHVTYNITVKEPPAALTKDTTPFVGNTGTQGIGQVITGMVITAGTSYDLNILTDKFPGEVVWSAENGRITVDEDGTITGVTVGQTAVTATINGVSYTIPVTVLPGDDASDKRVIDVYNTTTIDCTAYYSYNSGPLTEFPEGTLLYIENSKAETELITFFARPDDGYALTKLSAGGGTFFHPVRNEAGDGYGYTENNGSCNDALAMKDGGYVYLHDQLVAYVANNSGSQAATKDQIHSMLEDAVKMKIDGAFFFSRGASTGNLETQTIFIADKIATVDKTISGILKVKGEVANRVNYRPYAEGMVAGTDDIVFYTITVTQERPDAWQDGTTDQASLVYKDTDEVETALTDTLEGAYFYDKALDLADGIWDGVIDWTNDKVKAYGESDAWTTAEATTKAVYTAGINGVFTKVNIKEALNAPWGADELTRTLAFTVAYTIKPEDIPRYTITNTVEFDFNYNSVYSKADEVSAAATTLAKVTVVTKPMDHVIVDFTQPITITGLTNDELKYAFGDGDEKSEAMADDDVTPLKDVYIAPTATYGDVSVTKVHRTDVNGNPMYDGENDPNKDYPLYDYTVTYTPHTRNGMMKTNDVVQIWGYVYDEKYEIKNEEGNVIGTGAWIQKVINAFSVYPATTVYYEEDYIKWDDKWTVGTNDRVTGDQHLDYVGDADKQYNYGYDPVYNGSNGASNGTQATASTVGATGTFDFTGTGFEIYANCTEETGYVMVLVKSNTTGQIRLYTVNTKVGVGTSDATSGQTGHFYSVPIVSVQDLTHDSYNVRIVKSTDYGEDGKPTTAKPVNIDAVRIFQTMDPDSSNQIYEVDGERNPSFVELRDLVLTGADVATQNADGKWEYATAGEIVSQVYSNTGTLNSVVYINDPTNDNPAYVNGNLQDLLENGPKNELYLWPGQAVTFTLNAGVTAQIGMKTVSGKSVTYNYQDSSNIYSNCTMNSSTDMFYYNPSSGAVTITNAGANADGGVLSITLLKYWGASTETLLAEVSESQIAYALLSLRELPAKEAVLHVTAVDYTGKQIGSVRLAKPGAEGEYVVFTREELLAQLPEGYLPLDEVTDIRVTCGEEQTVSARIGKVATLIVEYVRFYKHTEVDLSGTRVPLLGKKIVTATLTKVQTDEGDAVFTAQEIWAAAPAGAVLHGLSDIQVAYGQTENISVFDTQLANSQVVPSIKL